jgi:hypothetical protein
VSELAVVVRGSMLFEAVQFEFEVVELIRDWKAVDGVCAFRDEVLRSARSAATTEGERSRQWRPAIS